jgi:hypothetical protein
MRVFRWMPLLLPGFTAVWAAVLTAVLAPLLMLSATSALAADKPKAAAPEYERRQISLSQPDCRLENCPRFKASWIAYKDDPALNAWIEQQLVAFATGPVFQGDCGTPQASVQDMADHFFPDSGAPRVSCAMFVRLKRQVGSVLVLELNGIVGQQAGSRSVDYDRAGHRGLVLADILLPGSEDRFFELFTAAETAAFDANSTDCPWPRPPGGDGRCVFPHTSEFEFTPEGIAVVHQLPPRIPGGESTTMQFLARYAQLKGILRPEWLPKS